jgi:HSP20 family molecular chaperone IbpA
MSERRPDESGPEAAFSPVADVYEVEGVFVVRLAVPGVLEEDIDISFGPEGLTVRGELEPPVAAEEAERGAGRVIVGEWRYGYFERCIALPGEYDTTRLHVEVESGVLEIRVPRGP